MDALVAGIQLICWLGLAVGAWFSITYRRVGDEEAARRHTRAWGDEPCYPAQDANHEPRQRGAVHA